MLVPDSPPIAILTGGGETLCLTQAQIAELFQKDVRTINEHLVSTFDEGELGREASTRKLRMVRSEGNGSYARDRALHLDAVLAVGFRVSAARSSGSGEVEKPAAPRGRRGKKA